MCGALNQVKTFLSGECLSSSMTTFILDLLICLVSFEADKIRFSGFSRWEIQG